MRVDDVTDWFRAQLEQTGELFVWALEQMPAERRAVPPPGRDEWSAVWHAFHLTYYERELALPSMRQWLGGAMPNDKKLDEDAAGAAGHEWDGTIAAFRRGRAEQIALLERLDAAEWEIARETGWAPVAPEGGVTLRWVVTKTLQHTAEHMHDVLRMALFWDYATRQAREQAR